jgi:hypothetical protein
MASSYVREPNMKLDFYEGLLNEARLRMLKRQSQRKVAAALGIKQSHLRENMKTVSTEKNAVT